MNSFKAHCKCGKNSGWLDIKDKDYKINCIFCKREYIVTIDGELKETIISKIKHFIKRK